MSKYKCKYGLYHDKPVVNKEPSSNNGWIYTAYSKYLGGSIDKVRIQTTYQSCTKSYTPLTINRLPNKPTPPFSKDEVIGCVSLGLLHNKELANSYYNFCNINRDFDRKLTFKSFIKAVKALYNIRNEHRNHVWQNEIIEAYPLAFKLAPWDIYYVKRMAGEKPSILESALFYLNAYQTIRSGNKSVRMLLWLQLEDMKHHLLKKIPKKQWVKDYFGTEHDFYKSL